ncbi:MAG: c-type cytochrome [Candidatus Tumulicola sp.]
MRARLLRGLAVALAAMVASGFALAQDEMAKKPVATRQLVANVCAACHGIDGNGREGRYPSLAGQGEAYLEGQLHAFAAQGGQRVSGVMGAIAVNLTPDQMKRVADYFSRQRLRPAALVETPLARRGETIFFGGVPSKGVASCATCHGVHGEGMPDLFPRLAGQHRQYLAEQLRRFRDGSRTSDPEAMMRKVAGPLSDREIDAVSQYLALLR